MFSVIMQNVVLRSQMYMMAQMIGLLPQHGQTNILQTLVLYLIIYGLLRVGETLVHYLWRYSSGRFIPYFNSLVSKDVFIAVHHHSIGFFNEEMAGKIAAKAKNIVSGIHDIYRHLIFGLIMPISGIVSSMFFIFMANAQLGFILGGLNLLFMIFVIFIRRKIGSYSEKRARFGAESEGIFVDTVTNSDLVKSFANYFYEKRHFYHALKRAVKAEQTELTKDAFFDAVGRLLFDFMTIVSCALIFYYWYRYGLTVADVVLCTSLIGTLINEIKSIGFFAGEFARYYGQVADGLKLLYRPCQVLDAPNAHNIHLRGKSIDIQDIDYHYENKEDLFHHFNLKIKSGEKVGLVGHSGSGKSTLIKLLVRYYDLDGGRILIGGEDIKKVRQESLRSKIAVIPQDTTLFNRTIMENIRYGNVNATDEEVIRAAKLAYADEFICKLPQGYESKVGERGVMLSGGERQRIAIARAILKDAPILILDEATSALDSVSEMYIQKSLKRLMKGKTVIAIAHRLSTLKEMDRLIVMDDGKIIEEGAHDDLIKRSGAYYKFYQIQSLNK